MNTHDCHGGHGCSGRDCECPCHFGPDARTASQILRAKMGYPVRLECPECGDLGPHDVNDDRREPTMLCAKCGMQTDVDTFEVAS